MTKIVFTSPFIVLFIIWPLVKIKQFYIFEANVLDCVTWTQNHAYKTSSNESLLSRTPETLQNDSENHKHRLEMWIKVFLVVTL